MWWSNYYRLPCSRQLLSFKLHRIGLSMMEIVIFIRPYQLKCHQTIFAWDVENFYCQYKAKLSMSNTRTWKYVKICKYLIITAYCHSHFDHYWDWVTMRCSCQSQAKQSKLPSLMRFSSRHFHFVPCFGWFCQKKNCWNYFFLAC